MHSIVIKEADFVPEEHAIARNNPNNLPYWLLENLSQLSFKHWLPVQAYLIPMIMSKGSDFIINAPTGSGKTLTYLVPTIAMISSRIVPALRVLIIAPTRELAIQIYKIAILLTKSSDLKTIVITGGSNASSKFNDEQRSISYGGNDTMTPDSLFQPVDILISTPGRLVDHLNVTPGFNLSNLQFLVLDEIDRIVDGVQFQDWINPVFNSMSDTRKRWKPNEVLEPILRKLIGQETMPIKQERVVKLLFSATITKNPLKLSQLKLDNVQIVTLIPGVSDKNSHNIQSNVESRLMAADSDSSLPVLADFTVKDEKISSTKPFHGLSISSELQTLESVPKFQIPSTLQERFSVVIVEHKPIYLLLLLQTNMSEPISGTLVFTKSVQSTEK